ncbi:e3 ubiquitin-protein ligase-like protein, partial [Nannochloropsis gaditana CCMP526]|uniref:e3 ubiquitin-protein ligase-like protein n=1 Tax=Nannochloropsis gaditana (strain CCMP526) TaxID=1093141 RepID=UPI00029F75E9
AGCMQIGWCDAAFSGDAQAGDGVGDGPHSWAYDGWREYRWHDGHSDWGARWQPGDVVGCFLDLDEGVMGFTLNGRREEIGMGAAFTDLRYAGGLYPCASFNRREKLQFNFGAARLNFGPPPGFKPLVEAVRQVVVQTRTLREGWRARERDGEEMEVLAVEMSGGEERAGPGERDEEAGVSYVEDCRE